MPRAERRAGPMQPRQPIIEPGQGLPHVRALDGLRAVAVIAVVLYHHYAVQGLDGWSGGFLGVDLFFVLSGFLITSLLLVDHDRTGRVISWEFWQRRARRLIPALLVFLVVVAVHTRIFVPRHMYDEVRRSTIATLLYVQNYWQLYGGDRGRTPLAHTWSLSIEEQFYLLWPIVLAGLLVWARGRPRPLLAALGAAVVASSAAMALLFTPGDPWRVYQGLDTRAHQLLVGACVAVGVRVWPRARGVGVRVLEIAAFAALFAISVLFFTVHFETAWLYRGGLLAVALGVAVILVAVLHPGATLLHRVLGFRPLVAIGLISYGLYLFHIPVFHAIEPGRFELQGLPLMAVRFTLTGLLAAASYLLVEQPIRRRASWLPPMRLLAPAGIVATVVAVVLATSGSVPTPDDASERVAYHGYATRADDRTRVLVIGDIVAMSLAVRRPPPYLDADTVGAAVARSGCGLTRGEIVVGARSYPEPDCGDPLGERIERATRHYSPHVVAVTAGPFDVFDRTLAGQPLRFGSDAYVDALRRRLDSIRDLATARGAHFALLTTPCMTPSTDGAFADLAAVRADATRVAWLNEQWRAYAEDRGIALLDLDALLCPGGAARRDPAWTDDGVSLNAAGADAVWAWLSAEAGALRPEESVGIPRRPDDLT